MLLIESATQFKASAVQREQEHEAKPLMEGPKPLDHRRLWSWLRWSNVLQLGNVPVGNVPVVNKRTSVSYSYRAFGLTGNSSLTRTGDSRGLNGAIR